MILKILVLVSALGLTFGHDLQRPNEATETSESPLGEAVDSSRSVQPVQNPGLSDNESPQPVTARVLPEVSNEYQPLVDSSSNKEVSSPVQVQVPEDVSKVAQSLHDGKAEHPETRRYAGLAEIYNGYPVLNLDSNQAVQPSLQDSQDILSLLQDKDWRDSQWNAKLQKPQPLFQSLPPTNVFSDLPQEGCPLNPPPLSNTLHQLLNLLLELLYQTKDVEKTNQAIHLIKQYLTTLPYSLEMYQLQAKIKLVENQLPDNGRITLDDTVPDTAVSKTTVVLHNDLPGLTQPVCRVALSKLVQAALSVYKEVAKQAECRRNSNWDDLILNRLVNGNDEPSEFDILYPKPSQSDPWQPGFLSFPAKDKQLDVYDLVKNVLKKPNPTPRNAWDSSGMSNPSHPYNPSPFEPLPTKPSVVDILLPSPLPTGPLNQQNTEQAYLNKLLELNKANNGPGVQVILKYLYPEGIPSSIGPNQSPEKAEVLKYLTGLGVLPEDAVKFSPLSAANQKNGFVELTYVVKRTEPIYYRPVYYVKYRLPYKTFVQNFRDLLVRNPELTRQPSRLYQELLKLSNVTQVSPELNGYAKDEVLKLVFSDGALVDAKLINGPSNEYLNEQLELIRSLNSDVDPKLLGLGSFRWLNTSNPLELSENNKLNKLLGNNLKGTYLLSATNPLDSSPVVNKEFGQKRDSFNLQDYLDYLKQSAGQQGNPGLNPQANLLAGYDQGAPESNGVSGQNLIFQEPNYSGLNQQTHLYPADDLSNHYKQPLRGYGALNRGVESQVDDLQTYSTLQKQVFNLPGYDAGNIGGHIKYYNSPPITYSGGVRMLRPLPGNVVQPVSPTYEYNTLSAKAAALKAGKERNASFFQYLSMPPPGSDNTKKDLNSLWGPLSVSDNAYVGQQVLGQTKPSV